ncbi:DUF1120 domain-containing protein [Oceanisphaera sp. KMM 10153]|uniref:DUF1120 domain-containing protein n=1 Tax=Oceanisphaera submarina TaxID=3390193 RepID=UPI003974FA73
MRFATRLSALALAAVGMVAAAGAQAQSIDVRVTGTVTPPACVPTLAGGGVVDFGRISARSLNPTTFNALPDKTIALSIACNAPTRLALRGSDNRAGSAVPRIRPGVNDVAIFGLGTVSGSNVGGYAMWLTPDTFRADGAVVRPIGGCGTNWVHAGGAVVYHAGTCVMASWSATRGGQPLAFSSLTGEVRVEAVLNRGDALPLQDEVPLDGLATLEMIYL